VIIKIISRGLYVNTGSTGFMLVASSLVMLMTPGLAFLWGLVGRKNVLTIMIQSFLSLCWTTVMWFALVIHYASAVVRGD